MWHKLKLSSFNSKTDLSKNVWTMSMILQILCHQKTLLSLKIIVYKPTVGVAKNIYTVSITKNIYVCRVTLCPAARYPKFNS